MESLERRQSVDNHKGRIDVIIVSKFHDLHIVKLAIENLQSFVDVRKIFLVTNKKYFRTLSRDFRESVILLNEDSVIAGMRFDDIRKALPERLLHYAGWYYQQLIKLAIGFNPNVSDPFLVWDADTIPLRKLDFEDNLGRFLMTKASEYHAPYFETYSRLIGEDAKREFSFIAQHMIFDKRILFEMLTLIETQIMGNDNWAYKIVRSLEGQGAQLFSEYETYGHFLKNRYPSRVCFRDLPWTRDGTILASYYPSRNDLRRLGADFAFASFETRHASLFTRLRLKTLKIAWNAVLQRRTR